jgi:signal transduction histidine kinase
MKAQNLDVPLTETATVQAKGNPPPVVANFDRQTPRGLAWRLLDAQETERKRLASWLHDELAQSLSVVKFHLQLLRQQCPTEVAAFASSIAAADLAIGQANAMALQLRPAMLDDLGLASALRWLVSNVQATTPVPIHLRHPETDARYPPPLEVACFRIAQQALHNAVRHASATRIDLQLVVDHAALTLRVGDDGQGFEIAAAVRQATKGIGLFAMEEWAAMVGAAFSLESKPEQGTRVHVHFPFSADQVTAGSAR